MVFAKLLAHSRCSVRPLRDSLLRLTAANRSAGWAEAASPVMPGARNSVGWFGGPLRMGQKGSSASQYGQVQCGG